MSGRRSIGRRRNEISPRKTTAVNSMATATGRPTDRDGSDILRPHLPPHLRFQVDQRRGEIEARLDRALLRVRGLIDRILELEERDGRPRSITLLRQSKPLLTEREGPVRDLDGAVGVHEVDQ